MDKGIEQLITIIRDYQILVLKKRRIETLKLELKHEKDNLILLEASVKKEHQDLIKIEKFSIKYLFNLILVNDKEQLEKEKQEYLSAIILFNESTKLIKVLEYEISVLEKTQKDEELLLKTLSSSIEKFNDELLLTTSAYLHQLKTVTKEIQSIMRLIVEAEEALSMLNSTRSTFLELISNIKKAQKFEKWGEFYHEIQKSKITHQENIDQANANVPIIKKQLFFLKNELKDVEDYQNQFDRSEVIIRGFNIEYYRDLILDWINDDNLIETLTTTMSANSEMLKLGKSLEKLINNSEFELEFLINKRSNLLKMIKPDEY